MGAATADAIYGAIAALGLTALTSFLTSASLMIRLLGGALLLYLGIKTLFAKPATKSAETRLSRSNLLGAYTSVLALTLTNPMTIISFIGIFAGFSAGNDGFGGLVVVLGVFIGSALWWLTLSGMVSLLRTRFNAAWMVWVNRVSGVIMVAFALIIWRDLLG